MSLLTYTVNRTSFSVPSEFTVQRAEGFGAYGDAVRATQTAKKSNAPKIGTDPKSPGAGRADPAQESTVTKPFIIRKFANIVTGPTPLEREIEEAGPNAPPPTVAQSRAILDCNRDLWKLLRVITYHQTLGFVPGVLPFAGSYRDQRQPTDVYCVFPALDCTLADAIYSPTPLLQEQVSVILRELAGCFDRLHTQGFMLGDLRPEWIWLDTNLGKVGSVSIANLTYLHQPGEPLWNIFGGKTNPDHPTHTRPLLWYRAPEIALNGVAAATPAADIWTLGCLLGEMLLQRPLFQCEGESHYLKAVSDLLGQPVEPHTFMTEKDALATVSKIPPKNRVSLAAALPSVPLDVIYILDRMLQWNPANRITIKELRKLPFFASVASAASAPTAAAGGASTQAKATAGPSTAAAAAAATAVPPEVSQLKSKWGSLDPTKTSSLLAALESCTVLL